MKIITEIETAEELVRFHSQDRSEECDYPLISPKNVQIIFDSSDIRMNDKYGHFQISADVTQADIIYAMAKKLGINIYIT